MKKVLNKILITSLIVTLSAVTVYGATFASYPVNINGQALSAKPINVDGTTDDGAMTRNLVSPINDIREAL